MYVGMYFTARPIWRSRRSPSMMGLIDGRFGSVLYVEITRLLGQRFGHFGYFEEYMRRRRRGFIVHEVPLWESDIRDVFASLNNGPAEGERSSVTLL